MSSEGEGAELSSGVLRAGRPRSSVVVMLVCICVCVCTLVCACTCDSMCVYGLGRVLPASITYTRMVSFLPTTVPLRAH